MLEQMGIAAKAASWQLALLSSREKNQVLEKIADYLEAQTDDILRANAEDLAEARANGLSEAMLDRLALTPARLSGIASDVRQVSFPPRRIAALPVFRHREATSTVTLGRAS